MSRTSDHRITLRLKPEEHARIVALAGDVPLSAFIREAALGDASGKRAKPQRRVRLEDKAAAAILARLGTHQLVREFRQAARAAENGVLDADAAQLAKIDEAHVLLRDIRAILMDALGRRGS
ncbi:hypothetical protein TRP8649_02297 [Pelagimonas phthalicica]|uniref:Mobilization protein n=1 Tax=Pelagimonas phthalicica TaxID=1037362 RepID=A0A238JDZ5_9RHOB|nr:hypothetical protein [Pelagimonas phthalicica]TDS91135.1 hypothetical protein CLV87_2299 [Pelagimonas phthalicica]SMX28182.1 hypothetical protein TRP8649_02297 [Pelagimonas phthalicica]